MAGPSAPAGLAGGSTPIGLAVATLLKNMIGAGIFSLPIGLLRATPVPGLAVMAFVGALSAGSYWMIGYCCITWNVRSFRELWYCIFGRTTAWIIDTTIFLNGWFTLVCYVVLIGDFTTKSFSGFLGQDHFLARNRPFSQWSTAIALLLPLSLSRDLSKLAFTSMLGLCVLVYAVILVIRDSLLHSPEEWSPDIVLFEWRMGAFEAVALYTHAFVAHYNAPKLFSELQRPSHLRWMMVVLSAYSTALVVYAIFAYMGLRRFEGAVQGNILRNFGPDVAVLAAWLGMGFSIAFTYPLVFNSTREAAVNLFIAAQEQVSAINSMRGLHLSPKWATGGRKVRQRSKSEVNVLGISPELPDHKLHHKPGRKATVLLVFMTLIVGTQVEDVGIVNALAGALMGVMVCLVLPGLLFLNTARFQFRVMASGSLAKPLLGGDAGHPGPPPGGVGPRALQLAMIAGAFTVVAGVTISIIGTAVILSSHPA